jgi:hypothetical protein
MIRMLVDLLITAYPVILTYVKPKEMRCATQP